MIVVIGLALLAVGWLGFVLRNQFHRIINRHNGKNWLYETSDVDMSHMVRLSRLRKATRTYVRYNTVTSARQYVVVQCELGNDIEIRDGKLLNTELALINSWRVTYLPVTGLEQQVERNKAAQLERAEKLKLIKGAWGEVDDATKEVEALTRSIHP